MNVKIEKLVAVIVLVCFAGLLFTNHSSAQSPAEYIPNDPKLDLTWARTINLLKAWAKIVDIEQTGQPKMQQAVMVFMEEWVDCSHPELQGQCLQQYAYNATDRPYANAQTHGTHAAGIGMAAADNGMGVAGVGGLMGRIKFIPIKVCDDQLCRSEWVLAGLQKVLEYKRAGIPIVVIGCNFVSGGMDPVATDQVLQALKAEGIDIVAPGPNSSPPINMDGFNSFPVNYSARYENIIPVTAGDESVERLAPFAAYGRDTMRLIASGVNVRTVSTLDSNGSANMSGSSAVTEQIAAAKALIMVYREPDSKKAREILYFTARMSPELEGKLKAGPGDSNDAGRMAGRIDIHDALTLPFGCPAPSSTFMWVMARDSNRLIAVDSVVMTRGPFVAQSSQNFFAGDRQTRISLYAYNIALGPDETASSIQIQAKDSAGHIVTLPVEFEGKLPNPLSCVSQLNLKLVPAPPQQQLAVGDVVLTLSLHGQTSSPGVITIRP